MKNHNAAGLADEGELFAMAVESLDSVARQEGRGGRVAPEDVWASEIYAGDAPAQKVGLERAADGLDLREFGHDRSLFAGAGVFGR